MILNGRKRFSLRSQLMLAVVGDEFAHPLGGANLCVDVDTKWDDCLFRIPASGQLRHTPYGSLLVRALSRGILIPAEDPHIRAAFALHLQETSLLKSAQQSPFLHEHRWLCLGYSRTAFVDIRFPVFLPIPAVPSRRTPRCGAGPLQVGVPVHILGSPSAPGCGCSSSRGATPPWRPGGTGRFPHALHASLPPSD